jgi:hypothetical protein
MNKGRLIGGIICLGVGILLGVLYSVLPETQMMFEVGGRNVPWVPAVILIVIGILLLATVRQGAAQEAAEAEPKPEVDPDKVALNKRMEAIAWGLFLVMLGGRFLLPELLSGSPIPNGVWSIGLGLILLGLNLARYFYQIKMSGFTVFLGIVVIIGGILDLAGMEQIEGPIFLIVLGAYFLLKPWFDRRALFGSAEER